MLRWLEDLLRERFFPHVSDTIPKDNDEEATKAVVMRQARGNVHLQHGHYITPSQLNAMREKMLAYRSRRT
jgi:hypothetical protein